MRWLAKLLLAFLAFRWALGSGRKTGQNDLSVVQSFGLLFSFRRGKNTGG
jgi:hypothetical protein